MYVAGSQLRKWRGLREPIDALFKKQTFLSRRELPRESLEPARDVLIAQYGSHINDSFDRVSAHLKPFMVYTEAEFQLVTDRIFKLNNVVFAGGDITRLLKSCTYVFPHIISSGREIEDYLLHHPSRENRLVANELCRISNSIARANMIDHLMQDYPIKDFLSLYPGEPGWEIQEGRRIFEIFEQETREAGLGVTSRGLPNVAYTAYGLMISK